MSSWRQLSQSLLSLFLQPNCPLCGRRAEQVICRHCDRQLNQCQLSHPRFSGKGNLSVLAWGKYEGLLKRAIASLKYEQQSQLAHPLGQRLGETWLKISAGSTSLKPVIVPIPLHPQKQNQRGYNQAELLARAFCEVTRLPLQSQGLRRIKPTDALFGLTPQQRENQVTNAFALGKGMNAGQVLLVDDIYTTGATVKAAQMTFQTAGINVIGVGAIAKA